MKISQIVISLTGDDLKRFLIWRNFENKIPYMGFIFCGISLLVATRCSVVSWLGVCPVYKVITCTVVQFSTTGRLVRFNV